ncbi:MAG: hypothetical protein K2X93_12395 [Candidatus Obscuribacterales bacterium]|nr:hypothetical protein [Candidatus Obscuribacterales bacterium]
MNFRDGLIPPQLVTDEPDWDVLESTISELYVLAELSAPKFIRVESPWQSVVTPVLMRVMMIGDDTWRGSIRASLNSELWRRSFDTLVAQVDFSEIKSAHVRKGFVNQKNRIELDYNHLALRCDSTLRSAVGIATYSQLRNALYNAHITETQIGVVASRLRDVFRPEGQIANHLRTLSSESRALMGRRFPPESNSEDLSILPGSSTLESELIEQLSDEILGKLSHRLMPESKQSHVSKSVNMVSLFSKLFSSVITDARQSFTRDYWLPLYAFPLHFLDSKFYEADLRRFIETWSRLFQNNVAHVFLDEYCFLVKRPTQISTTQRGQLHSLTGPAISYCDGFNVHSFEGVTVPAWVIESPDLITANAIDKENNVEIRRVLLRLFGESKYLEAGAVCIHQDELGQLYRKELAGDEEIVMVRVKNSTPNQDGTFDYYYIRVPPDTTTVKAAIAWSFRMEPGEYNPTQET